MSIRAHLCVLRMHLSVDKRMYLASHTHSQVGGR